MPELVLAPAETVIVRYGERALEFKTIAMLSGAQVAQVAALQKDVDTNNFAEIETQLDTILDLLIVPGTHLPPLGALQKMQIVEFLAEQSRDLLPKGQAD